MKKKIKELGKSDNTCLLRASEIQTAELLKSVEIAWKLVLLTGKLLIWLILLNSFKYSAEVQHILAVLLYCKNSLLPCLSTYPDLFIF